MKDFEDIKNLLGVDGKICEGKCLSTYKGGGRAFVFMPKSVCEFVKIYNALKEENKDIYVLGGGSNTIIKDGFCRSAIISTRELNKVFVDGDSVICECGASVSSITKIVRENGLGGLEFLSGVPCSIGGAIRMNAGAFSSQIKDYIDEISILSVDCENSKNAEIINKKGNFGEYSYRNGERNIVLKAVLKLRKMPSEESLALSKKYVGERRKRQPSLPSVGSIFKNGKVASGKLIEECGLKGMQIGGAQISNVHANFIVNVDSGSADDFLALAKLCQNRVYDEFGIILEKEFEIVE